MTTSTELLPSVGARVRVRLAHPAEWTASVRVRLDGAEGVVEEVRLVDHYGRPFPRGGLVTVRFEGFWVNPADGTERGPLRRFAESQGWHLDPCDLEVLGG